VGQHILNRIVSRRDVIEDLYTHPWNATDNYTYYIHAGENRNYFAISLPNKKPHTKKPCIEE